MKSALVFLLLVIVAGLVECKPSPDLRARVHARVADLVDKRARGGRKGDGNGRKDSSESVDDDTDWPYAWIEFSQLVGKCVSAWNWIEILQIQDVPMDGVLADACTKVFEGGEALAAATEEDLEGTTEFMRHMFPLLQCVNLHAEKEEVQLTLMLTEQPEEDNIYLKESAGLFAGCQKLFGSDEAQEEKFEEDVGQMEGQVEGGKRQAQLKALLRDLVQTAAKKR